MLDSTGFDLWSNGYDKSVNLSDRSNEYPFDGYKEVLNYIYKQVREKNNANVLDIGFGTGILTTQLYNNGYSITGIDFSSNMIDIAKQKMPQAKLISWDFSKGLPEDIKNNHFDYIEKYNKNWDNDEFYFIAEGIEKLLDDKYSCSYIKISQCAGVLSITNN